MEKLLPCNIEAECGTLGSIIIDPEAIEEVMDFLEPRDFYRDAHRTIYAAMLHLYEHHEPADHITLCDELDRQGQLDAIGGASYLVSLVNQVPTSGNVAYYGRIVERTAILRRLIHGAGQIAAIAYEQADADEALAHAEEIILGIRKEARQADFVAIGDLAQSYLDRLEDLRENEHIRGVPTGLGDLDMVLGGLQPGNLYILAARPRIGKTSMAQNFVYNAAMKHKVASAFFSLEMSLVQLMDRFVAIDSGIDSQKLRNGRISPEEYRRVSRSLSGFERAGMYLNETPRIPIQELCSKARKIHSKQPIGLIVVDYLQRMQATLDGKRMSNREQEVSEIAQGLKELARELHVPVLALAQLNREIEKRSGREVDGEKLTFKIPQLSDLRESGALEQEADVIMFLARSEEQAERVKVVVAKHRDGEEGELDMWFERSRTRFISLNDHIKEVR